MHNNPFLQPITPAAETDPVQNQDLIRALLGDETAQEFAGLVSDQPKTTRQPRPNLKALSDAALAAQPDLLAASAERQAERFFTNELPIQFNQQIKSLLETGFLVKNETGEIGTAGIDNKFYQAPALEQVAVYFTAPERKDFVNRKVIEGFTRVLITPFAASMSSFENRTRNNIREHGTGKDPSKKLLLDGERIEFDESSALVYVAEPFRGADRTGAMQYFVGTSKSVGESGVFKTKAEIIADTIQPFPGFRIQLLKDSATNSQKKNEASSGGEDFSDFIKGMQDPNSTYFGEHGLTPEDWFVLFNTTLHETNEVIHVRENDQSRYDGTLLTDCKASMGGFLMIPRACWHMDRVEAQIDVADGKLSSLSIDQITRAIS
ncbi:MAG: hypothetical protein NT003_04405 [Candidatus Magasanikbacteria bacterium]|nr:hypothetical protein [Candidatus Magasanikbacteria bacterium]